MDLKKQMIFMELTESNQILINWEPTIGKAPYETL